MKDLSSFWLMSETVQCKHKYKHLEYRAFIIVSTSMITDTHTEALRRLEEGEEALDMLTTYG